MTGTWTGIVIICVVVVAGLAAFIGLVAWSARRPAGKRRHLEPMRGVVQGGMHVGGGRSVMPTRDAPVPEGGGTPPAPEEQEQAEDSEWARHRSGSPMDL